MQEAGPVNFLRTLLIILLIYYAFKYVAKYLAPYLLKRYIHKMQDQAQQNNNQQENSTIKEGETVIDKKPNTHNQSNKNVGEYVDYEEIN